MPEDKKEFASETDLKRFMHADGNPLSTDRANSIIASLLKHFDIFKKPENTLSKNDLIIMARSTDTQ